MPKIKFAGLLVTVTSMKKLAGIIPSKGSCMNSKFTFALPGAVAVAVDVVYSQPPVPFAVLFEVELFGAPLLAQRTFRVAPTGTKAANVVITADAGVAETAVNIP